MTTAILLLGLAACFPRMDLSGGGEDVGDGGGVGEDGHWLYSLQNPASQIAELGPGANPFPPEAADTYRKRVLPESKKPP